MSGWIGTTTTASLQGPPVQQKLVIECNDAILRKAPVIVAESGRLDGVEIGWRGGPKRRLSILSRTQIALLCGGLRLGTDIRSAVVSVSGRRNRPFDFGRGVRPQWPGSGHQAYRQGPTARIHPDALLRHLSQGAMWRYRPTAGLWRMRLKFDSAAVATGRGPSAYDSNVPNAEIRRTSAMGTELPSGSPRWTSRPCCARQVRGGATKRLLYG